MNMTLWSTNWNQQKALELMLRSFAKHHYKGEPIPLMLIDNGSTDGSKEWLREQGIPFLDLGKNATHEWALNFSFNMIKTKHVLLVDSDVEFLDSISEYSRWLAGDCVSVGDLINNVYAWNAHLKINEPIKPRISPWFWLFDIQRMKDNGVFAFRGDDCENWLYDSGSWLWEKMQELGFSNHQLERFGTDRDWANRIATWASGLGMSYERFFHYSQVSCKEPAEKTVERRKNIVARVKDYQDVDLRGVFVGGNLRWDSTFIDSIIAKGWLPFYP